MEEGLKFPKFLGGIHNFYFSSNFDAFFLKIDCGKSFIHYTVFRWISSLSYGFRVKLDCSKTGALKTLVVMLLSYNAASILALYYVPRIC